MRVTSHVARSRLLPRGPAAWISTIALSAVAYGMNLPAGSSGQSCSAGSRSAGVRQTATARATRSQIDAAYRG